MNRRFKNDLTKVFIILTHSGRPKGSKNKIPAKGRNPYIPKTKTGVCAWCKKEFEYVKPNELEAKKTLCSYAQIFCSQTCENASRQHLEKEEQELYELTRRGPHNTIKVCPKCGFESKRPYAVFCSRCKTLFHRWTKYEIKEVTTHEI